MALRRWGMGVVKTGEKKSFKHCTSSRSVFAVSPPCSSVGIVSLTTSLLFKTVGSFGCRFLKQLALALWSMLVTLSHAVKYCRILVPHGILYVLI